MPSIKFPNNTLLIKKVLNDNFVEDSLEANDIPISTSGSPYTDIGVSGTNIQDAFRDVCVTVSEIDPNVAQDGWYPLPSPYQSTYLSSTSIVITSSYVIKDVKLSRNMYLKIRQQSVDKVFRVVHLTSSLNAYFQVETKVFLSPENDLLVEDVTVESVQFSHTLSPMGLNSYSGTVIQEVSAVIPETVDPGVQVLLGEFTSLLPNEYVTVIGQVLLCYNQLVTVKDFVFSCRVQSTAGTNTFSFSQMQMYGLSTGLGEVRVYYDQFTNRVVITLYCNSTIRAYSYTFKVMTRGNTATDSIPFIHYNYKNDFGVGTLSRVLETDGKWINWTPNYGGGGGMTFTGVTTYIGRYLIQDKALHIQLFANGTTGSAAGPYISATIPAGLNVRVDNIDTARIPCNIVNGTKVHPSTLGYAGVYTGPEIRFYRDLVPNNWGTGDHRQIFIFTSLELV